MMTKEQAREFASRWLPAWTGNEPEKLAEFYSDDALYLDPAVPQGIRGKEKLLAYFRRLLGTRVAPAQAQHREAVPPLNPISEDPY